MPDSYFMQWSANYYGNDCNRYQMSFAFLYFTHTALFGLVCPHMCVVVKETTAESWRDSFLMYRIEFSYPLLNVGEFHSKKLGSAWQKLHSSQHVGHKFWIIEEARVCTSDRNWTRERDVITVLSKVMSFLCHSSASLQDGFMCHSLRSSWHPIMCFIKCVRNAQGWHWSQVYFGTVGIWSVHILPYI